MKPKKIDLAAGRLGKPATAETAPSPHLKTNYGSDRLGIRAAESQSIQPEPLPQEPAHDMQPHDLPQVSSGESDQHLQLQQSLRETAAKAQQRPTPAARPSQLCSRAVNARLAVAPKFLYAGAAGLLCLIVIIFIVRSASKTPSVASAHNPPVAAAPSAYEPRVAPALPSEPPRRESARSRVTPTEMGGLNVNIPQPQQAPAEPAQSRPQPHESPYSLHEPPRSTASYSSQQPTRGAATTAQAMPTFRQPPDGISLSGIINCSDGAYASINGRMVKAGSVINGAKLIAVHDYSVEMELDGQRFVLGIGTGSSTPQKEPDDQEEDDEPAEKPKAKAADTRPAGQTEEAEPARPKKKRTSQKPE